MHEWQCPLCEAVNKKQTCTTCHNRWSCTMCTFVNETIQHANCQICENPRLPPLEPMTSEKQQKRKMSPPPNQPPRKKKKLSQSLMDDFFSNSPALKMKPKRKQQSTSRSLGITVLDWGSDSESEDEDSKKNKVSLNGLFEEPFDRPSSVSSSDEICPGILKKKQPKKMRKRKNKNKWTSGKYLAKENAMAMKFSEEQYEQHHFPEATILQTIPKKGQATIIEAIIVNNVPLKPSAGSSPKFSREDIGIIMKAKVTCIFGKSGSGKTSLLKQLGELVTPEWNNEESILANFVEDGVEYITAAGLRSVPNFVKPYAVLSQGERKRADFGRLAEQGKRNHWRKPILIDEFTSELDRSTARSMAASAASAIARNFKNGQFIFATCNADVLHYLQPDLMVYVHVDGRILVMPNINSGRRPKVKVSIEPKELLPLRNFKGQIYESKPQDVYGQNEIIDFRRLDPRPADIKKSAHKEEKIRGGIVLKNKVKKNPKNDIVNGIFDLTWHGTNYFRTPNFEPVKSIVDDKSWNVAVIHGPSGSGKSTVKKLYFPPEPEVQWNHEEVIENHFPNDAKIRNEIFESCRLTKHIKKPPYVLSNGEMFRAKLGRILAYAYENRHKEQIYVIDEFTSVLDRKTASEVAKGFNHFIKKYKLKRFVLVTCHADYFPHIELSWAYCASTQNFTQFRGTKLSIRSPSQRRQDLFHDLPEKRQKSRPKPSLSKRKLFIPEQSLTDEELNVYESLKDMTSGLNYRDEYIAKFVKGGKTLNEAINGFFDVSHPPSAYKKEDEQSSDSEAKDSDAKYDDAYTDEERKQFLSIIRMEIHDICTVKISDEHLNQLIMKHKFSASETISEERDVIEGLYEKQQPSVAKLEHRSMPRLEKPRLHFPRTPHSSQKQYISTPVSERRKVKDLLCYFKGTETFVFEIHQKDPDEQFWFFECLIEGQERCKIAVAVPLIDVILKRCNWKEWSSFRQFHYKTKNLQTSCITCIATMDHEKVGFIAVANMVGSRAFAPLAEGDYNFWHKHRWRDSWFRESRLVVSPQFQGMGIGSRISDSMGELMRGNKRNYSSKTHHPNFGRYRNHSPLWISQTTNEAVVDGKKQFSHRFAAKHNPEMQKLLQERVTVVGDFPVPQGEVLTDEKIEELRKKREAANERKRKKDRARRGNDVEYLDLLE